MSLQNHQQNLRHGFLTQPFNDLIVYEGEKICVYAHLTVERCEKCLKLFIKI